MQEPSQTGVRVSIQPTEGVAMPATPIYHHLPTMEGTRPGLLHEEMAGPSGRVWMQGMNPVNTMSMDEYVLRMQSLVEYSQQMMAETHALIQQSILTTTRYQEEVRGMYLNQNVETSPMRDDRRTDYGALGESLSRSISLAVSTAFNQATDRQTQQLPDVLLNRSRIQAEATHEPRTSTATPSEGLAETEGPRRAPINKGKARQQ